MANLVGKQLIGHRQSIFDIVSLDGDDACRCDGSIISLMQFRLPGPGMRLNVVYQSFDLEYPSGLGTVCTLKLMKLEHVVNTISASTIN